jgi:hypothetical protein
MSSYRTLNEQRYLYNLYLQGRGNLAAVPGTSNHGLGLAVDLATHQMRDIVDQIGAKYGWAKRWSDAPSEWWHIKWRSGVWNGKVPDKYKTLKRGQTGPSVLRMKKAMRKHGLQQFNAYTPFFDKRTEAALKRLQHRHGLKADGICGPKTWSLIT